MTMTANKAKKLIRRVKRKNKIAKKKLENQAKYNAILAKEVVPINITPVSNRVFDKSAWNTTASSLNHNVLGLSVTKKANGFDRASWNNEQRT